MQSKMGASIHSQAVSATINNRRQRGSNRDPLKWLSQCKVTRRKVYNHIMFEMIFYFMPSRIQTLRLKCSTMTKNNTFPIRVTIGIRSDEVFGEKEDPVRVKISVE